MLLAAAALTIATGDRTDMTVILLVIVVNTAAWTAILHPPGRTDADTAALMATPAA